MNNPLALVGIWNGQLTAANFTLLITMEFLKVNINKQDTVRAYLDQPDSFVNRYFVSDMSFSGDKIDFKLPSLKGEFTGRFSENDINGVWYGDDAGIPLPVNLKRKTSTTLYNAPKEQTPRKPYPYEEEEVEFENEEDGVTLSGTFTYPKDKKSVHSAVVLAHGSGGQDRDETLWEHKPFKVIADYFTRNGIAVLRFDERGVGKSSGDFASATQDDFAEDVLEAIEYLEERNDFKFKEIGIVGHSKGGFTAMRAANMSGDSDLVDFIVLLGSPGVRIRELMPLQIAGFNKVQGRPKSAGEKALELQLFLIELSRSVRDNERLEEIFLNHIDTQLSTSNDADEKLDLVITRRDAIQFSFFELYSSPWFHTLWAFDPEDVIRHLQVPVLALWGSVDVNVPAQQNYDGIKKSVDKNKKIREESSVQILPGLNHFFQSSKTGNPFEYGLLEDTFSPRALKIMKDWILD